MRITKDFGRIGLAACVAIAVSACSGAPQPQARAQAWTGTTAYGATVHPLAVDVTVDGADWSGTYTVGSTPPFTGDVVAELVDGVLTGQLIATSSCSFDLVGTVTADALDAAFVPTACPGGDTGTWTATPTASVE